LSGAVEHEFQVGRQPIPSTGCGSRKPCHQSSDSFLVRPSHSYLMNAATTVKECQTRAVIRSVPNRGEPNLPL